MRLKPEEKIRRLTAELTQVKEERKLLKRENRKLNTQLQSAQNNLQREREERKKEKQELEAWFKKRDSVEHRLKCARETCKGLRERNKQLKKALSFDSIDIWKLEDYSRVREQNKRLLLRSNYLEYENAGLRVKMDKLLKEQEKRNEQRRVTQEA